MNDRTGEEKTNNFGSLMRIIKYRNNADLDILFVDYNWVIKHRLYKEFKDGKVKCPYEKRVFNIGYLGEGRYNASINGKNTKYYEIWNKMLARCYAPEAIKRNPTYKDCIVHESWHNFQNFAEWVENNFYKIEGEQISLDKDILCKGNKIYSPNTCIFVPQRINNLFTKCDKCRGDLPIGVTEYKHGYGVSVSCNNKQLALGTFNTPHKAFLMYKLNKELVIQGIANEYKDKIPTKLYEALMNYEVEEGD